ncbi:NAD(P)-dependent oxidoreductase [bacterium]|nr:NAD(P)-dependent oxidoreductase [bacterium]
MTENDTRVYAEFLRNIIEKKDIILKSKGNQIRSYTYIADCVEAFFYILLKGENKNAYNVANPNSITSIKNMAEVIAKIGGSKVIIKIPKENNMSNPMQCGVLNTDKLLSLGFVPKYDLEMGYTHCIKILKEINNIKF